MDGRPEARQNRRAWINRDVPTVVLVVAYETAPQVHVWGSGDDAVQRLARWLEQLAPEIGEGLRRAWLAEEQAAKTNGEARALADLADPFLTRLPHGEWCGFTLGQMVDGSRRQRSYLRAALKAETFSDDPLVVDALRIAVEAIRGKR